MRLGFLGTPEAAVPSLEALVAHGHDVALVITRPDRRRGRGGALSASPVKSAALDMGLSVAHSLAELASLELDRAVVVAYGAMIPASLLERTPMLNVHFSLLPRWRGAAPVHRAILAGDCETGVAVMSLEATLDTGPVHLSERVAIGQKTLTQLTDELARRGADALIQVLASPELLQNPQVQIGEPTYAQKLTKETFHLGATMSTSEMLRTVRLEQAFIVVQGRRVRVLEAHGVEPAVRTSRTLAPYEGTIALVGDHGAIGLDIVQPEGSRPMSANAWWSGARLESLIEWN